LEQQQIAIIPLQMYLHINIFLEEKPAPISRPVREPRPVQERPQMRRESDYDARDSIDITHGDRIRDMLEEEEDEFYSDEDELDDFIVGDMDADGEPIRRRRKKKRVTGDMAGVTAMQLQAAREVFGDDIDIESMFLPAVEVRTFNHFLTRQ
jgi:hypothetical protein